MTRLWFQQRLYGKLAGTRDCSLPRDSTRSRSTALHPSTLRLARRWSCGLDRDRGDVLGVSSMRIYLRASGVGLPRCFLGVLNVAHGRPARRVRSTGTRYENDRSLGQGVVGTPSWVPERLPGAPVLANTANLLTRAKRESTPRLGLGVHFGINTTGQTVVHLAAAAYRNIAFHRFGPRPAATFGGTLSL
jgi:hypothetical protein